MHNKQGTQDIFFQKCKQKITMLRLMDKIFFDKPTKIFKKNMMTFERLQLIKEMIMQLAVC